VAGLVAAGVLGLGLLGVGLLGPLAPLAGASAGPGHAASLAQARRDLLVLSDMPSGWTSTKNPNTANNTLGDNQLAHCIGVSTALITENPPSLNSPQFQDAQGSLNVTDNVTVFPSVKNAAAEYAVAANPKMARCMTALATGPLRAKLFGKAPKGTTYGTPLVSAVDPSAFGPGVAGFALSVPITSHGITVNVTSTELFAVKGRFGHEVTFTAVGAPFSIPVEQHIMSVAAGRL
jgi:hypothetical protein